MNQTCILKWTNRHSGETGYVKAVNAKGRYFENTYDAADAKRYANKGLAASAIKVLTGYGEAENNDFEVVAG